MTEVEIRSRHMTPTSAMRNFVNHRATAALRPYRLDVRSATLRVHDINGPRGGNDKQCLLTITGAGGGTFVVEATNASFYTAVDQVMRRAGQTLRRTLGRKRVATRTRRPSRHAAGDQSRS